MESQLSPIGRLEKILLATDGSTYSEGAERVAIAMCAKSGAKLYAMSAIIRTSETGWMGFQADGDVEKAAVENLDRIERLAISAGVACEKLLEEGDDPYKVIVDASRRISSDLIVMGRRGRRGLARLMLGDATAKVIGNAGCGVLVVPEECGMWRNILVATDGSRFSDAAVVTAAALAKCCDSPLTVLSVVVPSHSERRQAEAKPIVDRVLSYMETQEVKAVGVVTEGNADEAIVSVAELKGADLIVLGSFGRTGIGRMLFGSKAERVINSAKCPVMIVRGA